MKMELKVVKNAFKYVSIALAILIMITQFYLITTEISNKELIIPSAFSKDIPELNYCKVSNMAKITEIAVKSVMAFVAGCLLSEKKFIRFGVL